MIKNKFKIISVGCNVEKWIEKCLDSVLCQTYPHWELIAIDDNSSDKTPELIKKYSKYKEIFYKRNNQNLYAIKNVLDSVDIISDNKNDILVFLDLDDWLASNDVLEYLNNLYQEKIWMTYGQYKTIDNRLGCCCPINSVTEYRKSGKWCISHLKTLKRKVFNKIKKEDFRDWNGEYIKFGWDIPIVYPAVELCGLSRIKFVDKILYIYNNEANNEYKDPEKQKYIDQLNIFFKNKPIYQTITGRTT